MKSTGHRVVPYSYCEDGTVTVSVLGTFNKTMFERNVFGVSPEDLEECDLPGPEEELGAVLKTDEEIREYLSGALNKQCGDPKCFCHDKKQD